MVLDPGTAILVSSALATAAQGAGQALSGAQSEKAAKRRAKETERETKAGILQDALERSAQLKAHELSSRQKTGKARARTSQETADLLREAFKL